jgi:hypothetical protein
VDKRVNMFYLLVFSACMAFCILYVLSFLLFKILTLLPTEKPSFNNQCDWHFCSYLNTYRVKQPLLCSNTTDISLLLLILYSLFNKKPKLFSAFGKDNKHQLYIKFKHITFLRMHFLFNAYDCLYNNYIFVFLAIAVFVSAIYFFFHKFLSFNDSKINILLSSTAVLPFLAFLSFEL